MKHFIAALALVALALASPGLAQAQQVLKVGQTPPVPGQPLMTAPVFQAVAKDMGVSVEFVNMPFGDLPQALSDKKIDVIASVFTRTPEREKLADFSQSYASFRDVLIVPVTDNKTYTSSADFKGMTIAVTRGAIYEGLLKQVGANVYTIDLGDKLFDEVETGRAAGAVNTEPSLRAYSAATPHPKLKFVTSYPPLVVGGQPVSFQVAKGNAPLLARIDASLTKLKADGTLRPLVIAGLYNYP